MHSHQYIVKGETMKAVVCVKVIEGELNAFDACALESALRITDDVTVISMCPKSAEEPLRRLTRIGAKVILLEDKAFAGSDTLATSYILSLAIKKLNPDLIFCGRQTTDGDTAQVGPCLATLLGISPITNVMEICEVTDNKIGCRTRMGEEEQPLPALLTIERICELRFPSIFSKLGEIEVWTNAEIGADVSKCGLSGSPTKVLKVFENKAGTRKCKFISKDEFLPLVQRLNAEKRETEKPQEAEIKLKEVWAIGNEVVPSAEAIAESVRVFAEDNPRKIAELAEKENPEVILWNADLKGRRNAPITAALLKTGLCADCTKLETDGKKLYMYRPAKSGNVTAKIECVTYPQMATVRTVSDSSDIIVAAGKGVADKVDKIKEFAESIGAEFGASRGLVDAGRADYKHQIGLTGKTVSPQVYVAIGISGAVHHTCAIENAGTVIAINPDKDARIFEYADYGIIDEY